MPSALKEELIYHQYGNLLNKFDYFRVLNNDFVWGLLKLISKITYDKFDNIYEDDSFAQSMFLINKGYVKLYTDNDFAFAVYRFGNLFGDIEIMLNIRRNGTAKSMEFCQIYQIKKDALDELLVDYPDTRKFLTKEAIRKNHKLTKYRKEIMLKIPFFGRKYQKEKSERRLE